ncbi:O-methyltransferase [Pseudalkalibacillus berkeleyi]|uniref:O-methyltransferase n=1 Tax=Pseudalkalibacillus berkeleyi TaxID=1069813 RepID=A0ABS9GYL1_9BACL|nr:O-methyltransferase [Pseudalkalibacillus berkeleyi]MCF6136761.1 O-methyltransferase [Pseudalkalibacillus berkeleyi]
MMKLEQYIQTLFTPEDVEYQKINEGMTEIGMPTISVSPETGKLLSMLVTISGAKNILEVGALGGYSGICLLRGNPSAHLVSLELEESYANVAKKNVEEAGFKGQVTYKIGPALSSLENLSNEKEKYDFFFIDADKGNYINYLDCCIELANPGAIIAADNTLWNFEVLNENSTDESTISLRRYNEKVANHSKLESILLPIGDGLTLARVK